VEVQKVQEGLEQLLLPLGPPVAQLGGRRGERSLSPQVLEHVPVVVHEDVQHVK
jgi:hypothetical protein